MKPQPLGAAKTKRQMKVAIRADASTAIGGGHVTRCLALAGALRGRGAETLFICRAHQGNLIAWIRERGHRCAVLDSVAARDTNRGSDQELPPYAAWLGTHWRRDAEETINALRKIGPCDWLIVDHYSLGRHWEEMMRPCAKKTMVIDDLANREHDCDLLLDYLCGRREKDYRPLSPASCRLLLGSAFVLLHPEFAELRPVALARREQTTAIRNLLVACGGADPGNLTGTMLRLLADADLPDGCTIDVILGAAFPYRTEIEEIATRLPVQTSISIAVNDMAKRISSADLAIGASGGSAWERCCLGLPSITIATADNQSANAAALQKENIGIVLFRERLSEDFRPALRRALHDRHWYQETSAHGSRLVDGHGADRVADALMEKQ